MSRDPFANAPGPTPKYAVYILSDPREPQYPCYVGFGTAGYQHLWTHRNDLEDRLGAWFRELDANNLTPCYKSVGICVNRRMAINLANWELFRINWDSSGVGLNPPWWTEQLLNPEPQPGKKAPIKRVINGNVERFPSIRAATRAIGFHRRDIGRYVSEGRLDPQGGFWCHTALPRALFSKGAGAPVWPVMPVVLVASKVGVVTTRPRRMKKAPSGA